MSQKEYQLATHTVKSTGQVLIDLNETILLCTELKHGMAANRDERNGIGIIIAALKVMKDKAAARDSK